MAVQISDPRTDVDGLIDLATLWTELHRHHLEVSDYRDLVLDVEFSWTRRLHWYRQLVADGAQYVTATDDNGRLIGYAMVGLEAGRDDTFDVQGGIAEVISLVVTSGRRSAGTGTALLDAAEGIARAHGFDTVKIALMSGNARAQQFYEGKGYSVGEHVLYRRIADR